MHCIFSMQIPEGPLVVKEYSEFVVIRLGDVDLFVNPGDVDHLLDAVNVAKSFLCPTSAKGIPDDPK